MKFSDLKLTTPYLKLDTLFYERVKPTPLHEPYLICVSQRSAALLGVDEDLREDEKLLKILNGELFLEGSKPFAMTYAGHQFGQFVSRLGDGRAINLGKAGGQNLQLKGAGITSYSRLGDGRAVLRSSIREFLMSEAMHGLGIETSRAVALVGSQTDVARKGWEKGAMVLRLSPTWVRFGTFEYFYAQGEHTKLKELADYVIEESFNSLKHDEHHENIYAAMYEAVVKKTAKTLAAWQSVGFNHGVMNTDNMCIDGRTIDYGPFAFLDDYEKHFVCNETDINGRYSFASQVGAAEWNLNSLAVALSPLVEYELSEDILDECFRTTYEEEFSRLMYLKMGLQSKEADDKALLAWMLKSLGNARVDYTLFFRKLSRFDGNKNPLLDICVNRAPMSEWLDAYMKRLQKESLTEEKRQNKMLKTNPKYVLKNYILQEAIEKANVDDFSMIERLLKIALTPFDEHEECEYLAKPTPPEAKNQKLSCSS